VETQETLHYPTFRPHLKYGPAVKEVVAKMAHWRGVFASLLWCERWAKMARQFSKGVGSFCHPQLYGT